MYISFFKRLAGHLKQMPAKKRIAAGTLLGLSAAAVVAGTGPVSSYAARTSAGVVGSAKVGVSYKPGNKAYGVVEPGYFVVTPVSQMDAGLTAHMDTPDYSMMMEQSETFSATSIPDQSSSSLLFIPKMTWNNETGMTGNNSNWWVRDGSKNYGRDCSRYNGWLIRMNKGSLWSAENESQGLVYSSANKNNWALFNNIVFCEMDKSYTGKNPANKKEIGSAAVGDFSDKNSSISKIMDEGVYRDRIYSYMRKNNKVTDKKKYGYYDFDKLIDMDSPETKKFLRYVVYGDKDMNYKNLDNTLVEKSQRLWNSFTQITIKGGAYTSHVDRVNMFVEKSYNYAIRHSDASAYFSGKKLKDGSSLTIPLEDSGTDSAHVGIGIFGRRFNHTSKEKEWTDNLKKKGNRTSTVGYNTEGDGECRVYASNMYRLGYLDLMLSAYTIAVNQHNIAGGKSAAAAEKGWYSLISDYFTMYNDSSMHDNTGEKVSYPCWINIQMGLMTVQNKQNKDDGSYQLMFASSQDAVDASYEFETTGPDQRAVGKYAQRKSIPGSMSYPYPGYPIAATKEGTSVLSYLSYKGAIRGQTFFTNVSKKEAGLPPLKAGEYGTTYYEKLRLAEKQGGKNGYIKGYAWYSTLGIQRILSKLYDNGKEETSNNRLANIELIKSRVSISSFSDKVDQL